MINRHACYMDDRMIGNNHTDIYIQTGGQTADKVLSDKIIR